MIMVGSSRTTTHRESEAENLAGFISRPAHAHSRSSCRQRDFQNPHRRISLTSDLQVRELQLSPRRQNTLWPRLTPSSAESNRVLSLVFSPLSGRPMKQDASTARGVRSHFQTIGNPARPRSWQLSLDPKRVGSPNGIREADAYQTSQWILFPSMTGFSREIPY